VLCKEISEYIRNLKNNLLEIYAGEIYGSSCLNGRVYCSSPTMAMVAKIGT
jgi:hypothetical protein